MSATRSRSGDAAAETKPDLEAFVAAVLSHAQPLSQNTGPGDLGFGWIYYGLVRNLRPDFVVAIGSCRGFMPFCAARAVQDCGRGTVVFIDPSYAGNGHPGWGGEGAWSDADEVEERVAGFGLGGWIAHLKATSAEAFPEVARLVGGASVGVVIVDGAHTYENSLQDFELYSSLVEDGFVVFHDSTNPACDVHRTIATLADRSHPMITIRRDVGLTIVEVRRSDSVEAIWPYLCAPSNRGARLLPHVRAIVRPDDRVLDAYCGSAPLAGLLDDVHIVGWDRDPQVIAKLRVELPQHRWERIDERALPFADSLPDEIDVLLALGVSRPRCSWDPQHVVDNVRYLLGRYLPRSCLFETAAEYFDAEILGDLAPVLARLGYACRTNLVETDLTSFPRRKVLVGER